MGSIKTVPLPCAYCREFFFPCLLGTRARMESYKTYLYRVLKSVHPEMGISKRGMDVCESLVNDMYERLVAEAVRLLRVTGAHHPAF